LFDLKNGFTRVGFSQKPSGGAGVTVFNDCYK